MSARILVSHNATVISQGRNCTVEALLISAGCGNVVKPGARVTMKEIHHALHIPAIGKEIFTDMGYTNINMPRFNDLMLYGDCSYEVYKPSFNKLTICSSAPAAVQAFFLQLAKKLSMSVIIYSEAEALLGEADEHRSSEEELDPAYFTPIDGSTVGGKLTLLGLGVTDFDAFARTTDGSV